MTASPHFNDSRSGVARALLPRSVAIIGASANLQKRGGSALSQLIHDGFEGEIYPVNPRHQSIAGLRCYKNLAQIDGEVDLAVIAVRGEHANDLIEGVERSKVGTIVVLASGFGELGSVGKSREGSLVDLMREKDCRLIGPNTNGLFNLDFGLNIVGMPSIPRGSISVISQSGNVAAELWLQAQSLGGIGFSKYVGLGNQADVSAAECVEFLAADRQTTAIVMYIEGVPDSYRLLRACRQASRTKPVAVALPGRTAASRRAVLAHTGALAANGSILGDALRQAGVTVVERTSDLLPAAKATSAFNRAGKGAGEVFVVTDGGGHGALAVDTVLGAGMDLARVDKVTEEKLRAILPATVDVSRNPLDVAGAADRDPKVLAECVAAGLGSSAVDCVLLSGIFGGYAERFSLNPDVEMKAAKYISRTCQEHGKPVFVHSVFGHKPNEILATLNADGVPVFVDLDQTARAIQMAFKRSSYLASANRRALLRGHPTQTQEARDVVALSEPDVRERLEQQGIPSGAWSLARNYGEVADAFQQLNSATQGVAVRAVSRDPGSKSDVGAVVLNVKSTSEAKAAFKQIQAAISSEGSAASFLGVILTPMLSNQLEMFVAGVRSPTLDTPGIMFGLGGRFVELFKRTTYRVAPVTRREALEMVVDTIGTEMIHHHRGLGLDGLMQVARFLQAISEVVAKDQKIINLEMNPVVVGSKGVAILDAKLLELAD